MRNWLLSILSAEYEKVLRDEQKRLQKKDEQFESEVNQRVAQIILQMDPFEPLLKKYHGIFSEAYERPEEPLNEPSKIQLYAWAWGQKKDPNFKHLNDWLQNRQGNLTIRTAKTDSEWFFGRCAIAIIELYKNEVDRLAARYEDLVIRKGEEFDSHVTVEY